MAREKLQEFVQRPRVFILSSISDGSSDAESLCRYLLYSNQFQTEGLVACTSAHTKHQVFPEKLEKVLNAYEGVVDNLNKHVHPAWQYPATHVLKSRLKKGPETYGKAAINADVVLSPGAQLLYECILAPATQPLWILCWGGVSTLAQALHRLDDKFPARDLNRLLSRIRVYATSDQDDCGPWIRSRYPEILYIVSAHGRDQHGMTVRTGISGEEHHGFDHGGSDLVEPHWTREEVPTESSRSTCPDSTTTLENTTSAFLYLIQNGLGSPENPDFGSWGGRFTRINADLEISGSNYYGNAVDHAEVNDQMVISNHATVRRWREAVQNDLAARIQWSMEPDFSKTNHHPVITVNGVKGLTPVRIDMDPSSPLTLDADGTYDPAGRSLTYKWWHCRKPSNKQWETDDPALALDIHQIDSEGLKAKIRISALEKQTSVSADEEKTGTAPLLHLILEVTNNGTPALTSYRRVLVQVLHKEPKAENEVNGGEQKR